MPLPAPEVKLDEELKRELNRIDWDKYVDYGVVEIQVRAGKKVNTSIRRTYQE